MKSRIHVNQHNIRANLKDQGERPVITVKDYRANRKGHEAAIIDRGGTQVAKIVYSPQKPLNCGARVWIETDLEVVVDESP